MKHLLVLSLVLAALPLGQTLRSAELTAADLARHLGVRFWKFERASLPKKYSVLLQEIRDGAVVTQPIVGAFSFPEEGDLVIAISVKDGLLVPTVSVGGSTGGIHEIQRKKIGSSVQHHLREITPGVPVVLCGDYKSNGEETVATGKVKDVVSGLALLLVEKE